MNGRLRAYGSKIATMLEEYRDILALYEEFALKELKPRVLDLDSPDTSEAVMESLAEMGAVSDEMNSLPLPVRVAAVVRLAEGEGAIGLRVGVSLAMLEAGLEGYIPAYEGKLAMGKDRVYYGGKVGILEGEEVQTVGLRGIRWYRGEFVPQSDTLGRPEERLLLYHLAAAVGVGLAAYGDALSYAKERKAFGKPIYEYEEIRRFLNEGYAKLKAAEALLLTEGTDLKAAVWPVVEAATFMTEKATQIFGGYGYINEYAVSKYMRDVRMLRSLVVREAYV